MYLNSIYFELNNICNLNCIYCFQCANESKKQQMPYSLFLSTVGYAKLYGAKSIILSGGEVLLHPSWKEMVEVTIKNGLFLDFITNGTLINSKTASFFSNFEKDQFKITISLDGYDQETNDLIRGNGSFEKFKFAFERLSNVGLIENLSLQYVIKKNILLKIDKLVDFAIGIGVKSVSFLCIEKLGRAERNWDIVGLSDKEILFAQEKIRNIQLNEDRIKISFFIDLNFSMLPAIDYCSFGKELYLDSQGNVYGCNGCYGVQDFILGNLNSNNLFRILRSERFNQLIYAVSHRKSLINECENCLIVKTCAGGCMISAFRKTGNLFGNDGFCDLRLKEFWSQS